MKVVVVSPRAVLLGAVVAYRLTLSMSRLFSGLKLDLAAICSILIW